jgi:hypothetical protein
LQITVNTSTFPFKWQQETSLDFPEYLTDFFGGVAEATGVGIAAPPADPDALSEFQFGQKPYRELWGASSQLIFSGSYLFGLKASQLLVESRERGQQRTADEVMQQVAEAYHFLLAAQDGLGLANEALALLGASRNEVVALMKRASRMNLP